MDVAAIGIEEATAAEAVVIRTTAAVKTNMAEDKGNHTSIRTEKDSPTMPLMADKIRRKDNIATARITFISQNKTDIKVVMSDGMIKAGRSNLKASKSRISTGKAKTSKYKTIRTPSTIQQCKRNRIKATLIGLINSIGNDQQSKRTR